MNEYKKIKIENRKIIKMNSNCLSPRGKSKPKLPGLGTIIMRPTTNEISFVKQGEVTQEYLNKDSLDKLLDTIEYTSRK